MAQLLKAANTEGNKELMSDFSPVPSNTYKCQVIKSEWKKTKKKDGHYLQFTFKILEGEYAGKLLVARLNLDNPNPVTIEIANKELNSICQACNKVGVQDSELLHGIPIELRVIKTEATKTQPEGNDIKGYAPISAATTGLIVENLTDLPPVVDDRTGTALESTIPPVAQTVPQTVPQTIPEPTQTAKPKLPWE